MPSARAQAAPKTLSFFRSPLQQTHKRNPAHARLPATQRRLFNAARRVHLHPQCHGSPRRGLEHERDRLTVDVVLRTALFPALRQSCLSKLHLLLYARHRKLACLLAAPLNPVTDGTTAGQASREASALRGQAVDRLLLLVPPSPGARQPSPAQFPVLTYGQCHRFFGPISAGSRIPGRLLT